MTELNKELQQIISGLLYSTESDYPFELLDWQNFPKVNAVDEIKKLHNGMTVSPPADADSFFEKAIRNIELSGSEDAKITANRYRELQSFINNNFVSAAVFRTGIVEVHIYIVLEGKDGKRYGLRTLAIET